jgi:dihydroorotate dehydrogenase
VLWRALRSLLFTVDAERVHRLAMASLAAYARVCSVDPPSTPTSRRTVFGVSFPNPLGLAAGFDKDAEAVPAWAALGFGFVEVGTVTALAQPGNDKPRLFRIPADRALKNRLGFNNHGAAACARALSAWRGMGRVALPVGVNIGKSKVTPLERAAEDYQTSFTAIADVADYVVVNVSSPNTPGLRDLQRTDELARILDAVGNANAKRAVTRPILVKLAPDLALEDAHACARTAIESGCRGLVVSNTTIVADGLRGPVPQGPGGISGAPLFERSTAMLRALAAEHKPKLAFIGVGGVMDAASMNAKLAAGADLVQAYTGFIYGGPGFARECVRGLAPPLLPVTA